jgi:hypothetical protein
MKLLGRIWLLGLGLAGVVAIVGRDVLSVAIGMPQQAGPYILTAAGIALIALAIAPRFVFRRR